MTFQHIPASKRIGILLLQACALSLPLTAVASDEQQRRALSGRDAQLSYWYSLAKDCSSNGLPEVRVNKLPSHGSVKTEAKQDHPVFAKGHAYEPCNKQLVPVTVIKYQSNPGYTGQDRLTVDIHFPNGNMRTVSYLVDVRP